MAESLRVLIVEDSLEDAFLIVKELSRGGFDVVPERVDGAAAMQTALDAHSWDLIISDYSLPGFGGPAALAVSQRKDSDLPFIIVSGVIGEQLAVQIVKSGAHNYVMKDQLSRLVPIVRQELRAARERRIRQHAESTANYLASLVQSCDDAIVGTNLEGTIVSWNTGAERLFGYQATEIVGQPGTVLVPAHRPEDMSEILRRIEEGGHVESYETERLRKDGIPVEVLLTISAVRDTHQRIIGASMVAHDMTRRKLEENDRLALIQELTAALGHMAKPNVRPSSKQ